MTNFATIKTLERLRSSRLEMERANKFQRFFYRIQYNRTVRAILKQMDIYLKHSVIDAQHMLDIIHTLNALCVRGFIEPIERRVVYTLHIEETDNSVLLRYYINHDNKKKPCEYIEITTNLLSEEILVTTYIDSGNYVTTSETYSCTLFEDNTNHDFYNCVGRALLKGTKRYLTVT